MTLRMKAEESLLLIVDIQQKLAPAMCNGDAAIKVNSKLIKAAHTLNVPLLVSEQYSEGIGHSVEELSSQFGACPVVEKMTFSCMQTPAFKTILENIERKQIVVTGMETHVCVLQSVLDLIEEGYQVFVVDDAVASRRPENKQLGLERMKQAGAQIVSSEMVMFEWLGQAGTDSFKSVLQLIK